MGARNCILAYPNFVDGAATRIDGGNWRPELPLANLKDRLLVKAARSYDLALSSTRFWIDFGGPRDGRVVAIPYLRGSKSTRVRVRAFAIKDETTTPEADGGWRDLYPVIYPAGTLYYGHPSFWDGRMTDEDAALFPMPFVQVFERPIIARHWLIEIDDRDGPLGYVEVPRVFLAPGWQPSLNFTYGAGQVWEPRTTVQESWGGAEFFDVRDGRRVVRFGIDYLPTDEALTWAGDMQRKLGIDGQLFFIMDPADTIHLHRRAFLARMRALSPLEYAVFGRNSITFELAEVTR